MNVNRRGFLAAPLALPALPMLNRISTVAPLRQLNEWTHWATWTAVDMEIVFKIGFKIVEDQIIAQAKGETT